MDELEIEADIALHRSGRHVDQNTDQGHNERLVRAAAPAWKQKLLGKVDLHLVLPSVVARSICAVNAKPDVVSRWPNHRPNGPFIGQNAAQPTLALPKVA